MTEAVIVENVVKQYGTGDKPRPRLRPAGLNGRAGHIPVYMAVDRVSFSVEPGEIFGLLGPNGSGKSTLIRLIAARLLPDAGHISVFGHDVVRNPQAVENLVDQVAVEGKFFDSLSPMENLTYDARLSGFAENDIREDVIEILTRLGLKESSIFSSMELMSAGMQQKVAIARAVLGKPRLLLLEEPTMGLDPGAKREVQRIILELRELHGTTVLLTTHDMAEAESLCDRIAVIQDGKILALDTPENLKRSGAGPEPGPTFEEVFLELTGSRLTKENE